jgi:hypothetical protein
MIETDASDAKVALNDAILSVPVAGILIGYARCSTEKAGPQRSA